MTTQHSPSRPAARPLGALAVTPRPLADYRTMFRLTDAELLAGPILDCPAGASPFGAQVRAMGGTVTSVDRAYADTPANVVARARDDLARVAAWAAENPDHINWSALGSAETQIDIWQKSIDEFAADYRRDGIRYQAAELPELPFPDGHFSLTVSGNLLFLYPEYLDFAAHVAALLELARVTRGEVRVFPLVDTTARPCPWLDDVRAVLARNGVTSEIRSAAQAFLTGGDHFLVCTRQR